MSTGQEPTAWELDRRFSSLERSISEGFARLDARLDRMVTTDVYQVTQRANEARLESLETEVHRLEDGRAADRRMVLSSGMAAGIALLSTIVSFVLGNTPTP